MLNFLQYAHGPIRVWIVLLIIWTLIWKGLALWKASHKEQKAWFIVMLVVNTVGILEILYLFVFSAYKKHTELPPNIDNNSAVGAPQA